MSRGERDNRIEIYENNSGDEGKKLENTVFLQLYRNRTPIDKIYYYQGKGECDFVVQRGIEVDSLIQVTWDMSNEETRRREIDDILEASKATGCTNLYIITYDTAEEIAIDEDTAIHVIPAWRWLLDI